MPSTAEETRLETMVVLVEAQLSLVRHLLLQLTRNGTPATQLVGFHARLDQLEASVARTTALLSGGHESHGCRSTARG
jgi:hypothetical protein